MVKVRQPGARLAHHGFTQRVRRGVVIDGAGNNVAVEAIFHPDARQHEADHHHQRRHLRHRARTQMQLACGAHLQIGRALRQDHRDADHARQQPERIEQLEEVTGVVEAQKFIRAERHALQQIAERDANHQRRHKAADKDAPVPHAPPAHIFNFRTIIETYRTKKERRQHQNHRHIEAGEGGGIHHRPGGEQRPARGDQPDLVAVPVRRDAVDHNAAFGVVTPHQPRQHADAHIKAVRYGEAHQQNADQQPPDKAQNFIIKHGCSP